MASTIGLLVLFLATLTIGGCAGMPLGYGDATSGYGYGGSCPQPYGGSMPVPMPMGPGCAAAAPPVVYVPQPQLYYTPQPYSYNYNGPTVYAPAPPPGMAAAPLPPQADPTGSHWNHQREWDHEARIHQGRHDGSLTPPEAQRLGAEQRHIRGDEGRMRADGNLSPHERGRPNIMQNRANQDLSGARHNGMGRPDATGPQHGNGHSGPMNSMGQPQINGSQTHRGMQPQARSMQPGAAPKAGRVAEATPGQ